MRKSQWNYENFQPYEFACKCKECKTSTAYKMKKDFMDALQYARTMAGIPFKINRGYSCKKHNASIKGASPTSEHTKGLAVDIACDNPVKRSIITRALNQAGIYRIKFYKSHIHADMSKNKSKPKQWLEINF